MRQRYYYSRLLATANNSSSAAAAHHNQTDKYDASHRNYRAGDLESESGSYPQERGHGSVAPRDLLAISFEVEWPSRDC